MVHVFARRPTFLLAAALSLIINSAIASPDVENTLANRPQLDAPGTNTHNAWKVLDGKKIGTIEVIVKDIFDEPNPGEPYETINGLKVSTKQHVIGRELLFKEGDSFDHFRVSETERVLRALPYLRRVEILPELQGDIVNIKVVVQDTWTLIPQANYSSGTGGKKRSVGISENNLGGLGKRLEFGYEEDQKRTTLQGVYEDTRFMGTFNRLLAAYFDLSDGDRSVLVFGRPFRSLLDESSWTISSDNSNTIGRLYYAGDERYIFRHHSNQLSSRYTISTGDPESDIVRYSVGYDYSDDTFDPASKKDYSLVGLDPRIVSNDPRMLADDRLFSGPVLTLEKITPNYISMNYIDRFDRVQDYNLGDQASLSFFFAPKALGSTEDTLSFTATKSDGYQFDLNSFIRGEAGVSTRYDTEGFSNTVARAEAKYYKVLGPKYISGLFVGKHTLATNFSFEYGNELDEDREFLVGGDNAIRGYKARTFFGDKRLILNIEDRVHLADDVLHLVSMGAAFFADAGGATNANLSHLIGHEIYSDVGVGLRFAFPRSSGGSVVRADVAVPLRDGPADSNSLEFRIIFAGGQLFGSSLRSESVGPEKANVSIGVDR